MQASKRQRTCLTSPAATPASPLPQTPTPVAAPQAAPPLCLPWEASHLRGFLQQALARLVRLHPQCGQVLEAGKLLELALELFR